MLIITRTQGRRRLMRSRGVVYAPIIGAPTCTNTTCPVADGERGGRRRAKLRQNAWHNLGASADSSRVLQENGGENAIARRLSYRRTARELLSFAGTSLRHRARGAGRGQTSGATPCARSPCCVVVLLTPPLRSDNHRECRGKSRRISGKHRLFAWQFSSGLVPW